MNMARQDQIERVYQLLDTYGPATAFDYMERVGGVKYFPLHLLTTLRRRCMAHQGAQDERRRTNGVTQRRIANHR